MKKRVVVALGHRALGTTLQEQKEAVKKTAKVIVPDYQLSLAIGKEGQNARLAARLTGFKIDIKRETQAREAGDFDYVEEEEYEEEDNYDESAAEEGTISAEENFDENDVETAEKAGDEE